MTTMLIELHRYQDLKLHLQKLNLELAALAAGSAISDTKARLSKITAELAAIEASITEAKRQMKRWEDENAETQEHLRQSEKKLYDGSIAHAKELTQLQQKNDAYRETIQKTEESIFGFMEQIEQKEAELQKIQGEKNDLVKNLGVLETKNQEQNDRYKQEIAKTEAAASQLRQSITPELLVIFEKISRAHQGIAVAELQGETCGACHISLSSAIVQRVKKSGDKLQYCENCGRIVYLR